MQLDITGLPHAYLQLRRHEAGLRQAAATSIVGGSPLPYFEPIEFGRFRSGRISRRAGPALMLTTAYRIVAPTIEGLMVAAIPHGADRVAATQRGIASRITRLARQRTPVQTGALRSSIHTRSGPRVAVDA